MYLQQSLLHLRPQDPTHPRTRDISMSCIPFLRPPFLLIFPICRRDFHHIQRSLASVAALETRRRDRSTWFNDPNLLYFRLKRIEFLVTQEILSEVHFYRGARQGLNHFSGFDESFVSIHPEWAMKSNFMESNSSLCFDGIGHSSVSVSITGISSVLPLVLDFRLYAGTLPSLPASTLSRSAR
ncbi:hypothetical protein M405DRAFT_502247 [Rhizopogon salebrosus TDB-379]|nr:hypothetical protein M405DRAFT_502247 [Rhizopogon salebrosus TDB-379]